MKLRNIPECIRKKKEGDKIVMLTCYDAAFAKILDQSDVDLLLVGDSLGMVIQGCENTLPVTLEDILYHTRAVRRGAGRTIVVADLPFMSYQPCKEEALKNAGRCLKEGGAHAVKLEGGLEQVETVRGMTRCGIPVMGHIGLQPQSLHQLGGYKIQGKTPESAGRLRKEAAALQEAGCFSIVLEGIQPKVAKEITDLLNIPTIGIASGPHCDGQVLVLYDLLGLDADWQPKFAKRYMEGHAAVRKAVQMFSKEIREGTFPLSPSVGEKENLRVIK